MALILNLETATKTCSVALAENGVVLSCTELTTEKFTHAEKLNGFIQDAMSKADKKLSDLDAVAISAGPGSYTGLRIGTSTAKGLCYALEIPLIAVNSLKALAALAPQAEGIICPMFDARRMEVYCCLLDNDLKELQPTSAVVINADSFHSKLKEKKIRFIGPGAAKCGEIIRHENAVFDLRVEVSAKGMAGLSFQKFQTNRFEDVAYYEPVYLKDFVAGTPKTLL